MAFDPDLHDAGIEREFGRAVTPFVGNVAKGLMEATSEDITGTDTPHAVALVVWITLERLSKTLKINLRPWFAGRWLLNTVAAVVKTINPPDVIKGIWARAIGTTLDTVWDGIVDGVRLRANDHLTEWGKKMSHAERMKLMGPEAYNKAKAFVDRIFGKAEGDTGKVDEATAVANDSSFGSELDYDVYLRDMEESGDDAKMLLAAELIPLWQRFPQELPKHAEIVGRASLLGFMKVSETTQALRADRAPGTTIDPENPKVMISKQHYKLKILAGFAKDRLEARTLTLVDPPKPPQEPPSIPGPGTQLVHERRRELARAENARSAFAPYAKFPLPFIRHWKGALVAAVVLVFGLVLAMALATSSQATTNSRVVTRTRVTGAATRGTKNLRVNQTINPNNNRPRTDSRK